MVASVPWRLRWQSRHSLWCYCFAAPASPRWHFRCDVSTPRGKPLGWLPGARMRRRASPPGWRRPVRRWRCVATGSSSLRGSGLALPCCPAWSFVVRPWPSTSRVRDESGTATVLAAVLIAALVGLTVSGILAGGVVIARHRAQAAADLAALAGASRLPAGPDAACRTADAVGAAMGASLGGCAVDHLDVVVTCTVHLGYRPDGTVRALARAGPVRPR